MKKPRIFIASAVDSLDVADAMNVNLDHDAEVTVWKDGFKISSSNIENLVKKALLVDFAIFIFTPDDVTIINEQKEMVVRDNVLFELGLFIGTLGKKRCFIVKPRGVDLHFPTDLLGLTPTDYEAQRQDGNLTAAVNAPCTLIKNEVREMGLISENITAQKHTRRKVKYDYTLGDIERHLLVKVFENHVGAPDGAAAWETFSCIEGTKGEVGIASIKLERLGLLAKGIETDHNGYPYYFFTLTEDGLNYILENEHLVKAKKKEDTTAPPSSEVPF